MASTISAANLKVKITEEVILNGKDQGGTTELTIGSINEIYKYVPEYQMRWFLHLGKQTVVKALNQYLK